MSCHTDITVFLLSFSHCAVSANFALSLTVLIQSSGKTGQIARTVIIGLYKVNKFIQWSSSFLLKERNHLF